MAGWLDAHRRIRTAASIPLLITTTFDRESGHGVPNRK
jgi:hypothetical protein